MRSLQYLYSLSSSTPNRASYLFLAIPGQGECLYSEEIINVKYVLKRIHTHIILQIFRVKSWKRRWFILNDNCLYYFEFTTDKEPRGIIPLENIRVRETADRSKQHCFELFAAGNEVIKACKTDSDGKVVEGKICTENLFLISNL